MALRETPGQGSSGSYDVQEAERRDKAAAAHRMLVNSPAAPSEPPRVNPRWRLQQLASGNRQSCATPESDVFEPISTSGKKTRFQMTPHPITGQHLIIPPGRTRSSSRTTPRTPRPGQDAGDARGPVVTPAPAAGPGSEQQRGRRLCCAGLVLVSVLMLVALCVGILASQLNNDDSDASHSAASTNASEDSTTLPSAEPSVETTTVLPATGDTGELPTAIADQPATAATGGNADPATAATGGTADPATAATGSNADPEAAIQARNGAGPQINETSTTETSLSAGRQSAPEAGTEMGRRWETPAAATREWQDHRPPGGWENGDTDIPLMSSRPPWLGVRTSPMPASQGLDPVTPANQEPGQNPTANPRPTEDDESDPAGSPPEQLLPEAPDGRTSAHGGSEPDSSSEPRPLAEYPVLLDVTAGPWAAGAYRTVRRTVTGGDLDPSPEPAGDLQLRSSDLGMAARSMVLRARRSEWEWAVPSWALKTHQQDDRQTGETADTGHRASSCFGPRSMVCPGQESLCAVRCDSVVECPDLADERNCACADRLSPGLQCDGYFDCPDESDEMSCDGCAVGEFSCSSRPHLGGGRCVPRLHRCDGVEHCDNGRDEQACLHLSGGVTPLEVYPLVRNHGFLHRLVAGRWLPVCHTGRDMSRPASQVCEGIVGRFTIGTATAGTRLAPGTYTGEYAVLAGTFSATSECRSGEAVYVRCPPPACGHTTQQLGSGRQAGRPPRDTDSASADNMPSYFSGFSLLADRSDLTLDGSDWDLRRPSPRPFPVPVNSSTLPPSEVETLLPPYHGRRYHSRWQMDSQHGGRIVGGARSAPGRHPWLCAIYRDGLFSCGGTVLTERWALTAAHCVERFAKYRYEIHAGMLRRQSFAPYEQSRLVSHIIVHPDYNSRIYAHDLALLRLSRPLVLTQWVAPICLPDPHGPLLAPGSQCTVVGWGQTSQEGPEVNDLMEVEIPVLSFCPEHYDNITIQICAGPLKGGKDSCQGDSGGPLLCRSSLDDHWTQYGIVSHGRGCALPNSPGVYTRVSYYRDWIRRLTALDKVSSDSLPVQQCTTRLCRLRGGMCLTEAQLCDKQVDCLGLDDERFCGPKGTEILPVNSPTTTTTTTLKPESPPPPAFEPPAGSVPANNGSGCGPDQFQCLRVSQCVPDSQRCDTRPQCGDYSDEASCSLLDYLAKHQPDRVCDRHIDLPDAADEELCCPPDSDQFYCPYSQRSIPLKWCCDRQTDCEFGEDEADCVALVNEDSGSIELDRLGRPLKKRSGVVAIKSDYSSGASWTAVCTESHSWIRRYSDVICNYLHQGAAVRERRVPVGAGVLQPQYPEGPPLYQCGRTEADHSAREDGGQQGPPPQGDTESFQPELSGFARGRPRLENGGLVFENGGPVFEDGGPVFEDDVREFDVVGLAARSGLRYGRGRKGEGLHLTRAHSMLDLLRRLSSTQPIGRSSCTGVQLTCGNPEPVCGHRPALKQLRDLEGPDWGYGVPPYYCTVYRNGQEVSGSTLISQSWVVIHSELLAGARLGDYVTVRCGQYRRQLFTTGAQKTVRVDFQSRDGAVALLHLVRPLAVGEDVYPACLPPDDRSGVPTVDGVPRCRAVGWDGDQVTSVKLIVKEVCPDNHLCTMPSSTASCKTKAPWSGTIVCQSEDRLWHAMAVFRQQGPHCFRQPASWPRLFRHRLQRQLTCLNISLTAPPGIGEIFRDELLDSCPAAVAMSEPPCAGHRCQLGQCLHPTQVCNGVPECDDGSDELDCDFNITSCEVRNGQCECAEDQIQCAESGSCWHYRAFCDGRAGCLSGADEPDVCTCRGFLWLAAPELICDQNVDCKTGDDEFGCQYEANQFRCYRDATVHLIGRLEVCDGVYQCAGGEDEEYCLCLRETMPPLSPDYSGKLSFNVTESHLGAPRCDSSGYLMVRVLGRWVAVKDRDMWNEEKSRRVCAKLGYHKMTRSEMRPMHHGEKRKSVIHISCE